MKKQKKSSYNKKIAISILIIVVIAAVALSSNIFTGQVISSYQSSSYPSLSYGSPLYTSATPSTLFTATQVFDLLSIRPRDYDGDRRGVTIRDLYKWLVGAFVRKRPPAHSDDCPAEMTDTVGYASASYRYSALLPTGPGAGDAIAEAVGYTAEQSYNSCTGQYDAAVSSQNSEKTSNYDKCKNSGPGCDLSSYVVSDTGCDLVNCILADSSQGINYGRSDFKRTDLPLGIVGFDLTGTGTPGTPNPNVPPGAFEVICTSAGTYDIDAYYCSKT